MTGPPATAEVARPRFEGTPARLDGAPGPDGPAFEARPFEGNGEGPGAPFRRRRRRGRRRGRGRGPRPPLEGGGSDPTSTPPPAEPT